MYADIPFIPYIISSLKLLISSFSVAKTPTNGAFASISSFVDAVHNAASLKFSLLSNLANKSAFISKVAFTLS